MVIMSSYSIGSDVSSDSEEYESTVETTPMQSQILSSERSDDVVATPTTRKGQWQNLLSFWLLGLTNNFAYVVMLSAAHDILSVDFSGNDTISSASTTNSTNPRDCNKMSTGTILLADIIPSLILKIFTPFIWSHVQDMISTWSSGTGGAGVFGALTYAGLTSAGLNPHTAVLLMLIVPIIMSLSFWVILDHPYHMKCNKFCNNYSHLGEEDRMLQDDHQTSLNLAQKLQAIPRMFKYMIPLGMVYVAEYVINQGLLELIYFPQNKVWMNHHDQYRWYQVTYQIGVLISRSSVNLIHVHHIWMTSVLQWINLVIFLTCAIFWWIGSIWMVLLLIFWEGLLGGAAYVNTFYRISQEVDSYYKEFAMGITTVSDSLGVAMAGIIAIPLHNVICNLPLSSSGT
ncbi:battenin isoform X3 [Panulirus ornatus]|uniref:battenin isoform X3 n=1 Tax=Panulirus ornatus TaxID=150431 RepID=UPI003A8BE8B0